MRASGPRTDEHGCGHGYLADVLVSLHDLLDPRLRDRSKRGSQSLRGHVGRADADGGTHNGEL